MTSDGFRRGRARRVLRILGWCVLAASAVPTLAHAQIVEGTVIDAASRRPLADVNVWLEGPGADTTKKPIRTSALGQFALFLDRPGVLASGASAAYKVHAQRVGYLPTSDSLSLALGQVVSVRLTMSQTVIALTPMMIVARKPLSIGQMSDIEGFELRRDRHYGSYLTSADLQQRMLGDLDAFLLMEIPSLHAADDGSLRMRNRGADCTPHVYVDGFLRRDTVAAAEEMKTLMADQLYGVEWYRPGSFPLAMGGTMELDPQGSGLGGVAQCGVIAIWRTKGPGERRAGVASTIATGIQMLRGTVYDADTHEPLADARVTLVDEYERELGPVARSDSSGAFALRTKDVSSQVVGERFRIVGQRIGYQRVRSGAFTIASGEIISTELEMSSSRIILAPMTIVARERPVNVALRSIAGFEVRKERGLGGTFFTADDIDKRAPLSIGDLLRGMAGVVVTGDTVQFRRQLGGILGGNACLPGYFMDGMPLPDIEAMSSVMMSDVYGVEVYKSATELPGEFFGPNSDCGAIIVWTKHGRGGGPPG